MEQQVKLIQSNSITLDLIRAITAQLVLIGHGVSYFKVFMFLHKPNFPWIQNIGVLVFFILSGFLISYSVNNKLSNVNYTFKNFFIDRFSRIYTAFIPAIILVILIDYISITINKDSYNYYSAFNLKTFIGNVLMLQDFPFIKSITSFGSARIFWTLAMEWWIYLFFGYIIFVINKKGVTFFRVVILFLLSIVPIYNTIGGRGNGLFIFWIFGAIIFLLFKSDLLSRISTKTKFGLLVFACLLSSVRVLYTMEEYESIFAFLLAISLLLLLDLTKNVVYSELGAKIIKHFANVSYTLYLVHYSILDLLVTHFSDTNHYTLFFVGFLTANVVSFLLGNYTELRLTKLVKSKMTSYIK